jgi:predicted nucleic acid-binding protein
VPSKVYVDTNIVIDICDETRIGYHAGLETIMALLKDETVDDIYINSDTLSNLFYILRSRSKIAQDIVLEKMRFVTTIFTLVSVEIEDVNNTLDLCEDMTTSFEDYEDTMQYSCAKKLDAELILTNDKRFVSLDIEVCGTKDFKI